MHARMHARMHAHAHAHAHTHTLTRFRDVIFKLLELLPTLINFYHAMVFNYF